MVRTIDKGTLTADPDATVFGASAAGTTGNFAQSDLALGVLGVVNVRKYRALAVGGDYQPAFAAALVEVGANGTVLVPKKSGAYTVLSGLPKLLAGQKLVGMGGDGETEIQAPAGSTFPVVDIDGVDGCQVRGIRFTKASGAALSGTAYAVYVRGAADDTLIQEVVAEGYVHGVHVAGQDGTVAGTVGRVTCVGVTCNDSPSSWGFHFDEVADVTLNGCYARNNWLDGVKLRRNVTKYRAIGGAFTYNGASTANAGDGIDCYAGGQQVSLIGGDYSYNGVGAGRIGGNGITIKTDTLNESDPTTYGVPRDIAVIGVTAQGNNGTGVGVYSFDSPSFATTGTPLLAHTIISGCIATDNVNDGIIAGGRNQTVAANISRNNGLDGIYVSERANGVSLSDNHCSANARGNGGTAEKLRYGIYVAAGANGIRIAGGTVFGVDDRDANTEADLAALTKYHKTNIYVHASATNVTIVDVDERYSIDTQGIQMFGAAGSGQVVRYLARTGTPNAAGAFGGVGSLWTQHDAAGGQALWVKATGGASVGTTTGWYPLLVGPTYSTVIDPSSLAAGASAIISITAAAAESGDYAIVKPPTNFSTTDLDWAFYSCTTGNINIRIINRSAGPIDAPSGTWNAKLVKGA